MKRAPIEHAFTTRQANIMQQAVAKTIGQTVRGPTNVESAKELERVGLVVLEAIEKNGYKMKPTPRGREAWHNFGLKAAGRAPVCFS